MNITQPLLTLALSGLLLGGCSDGKPSKENQTDVDADTENPDSGTSTNSGGSVSLGTKRSVEPLAASSDDLVIRSEAYTGIYVSRRVDRVLGIVEETYTSIDSAGTIRVFDYQQSNKTMLGNCYQEPSHPDQMNFHFQGKQLASLLSAVKPGKSTDGVELSVVADPMKEPGTKSTHSTQSINKLSFLVTQRNQTEATQAVRVTNPTFNDLLNGLCEH